MPNNWKEFVSKKAKSVEQKKTCKTCGTTKSIKFFSFGGGTYRKKDNCNDCSPPPDHFNFGGSRKYKDKKNHKPVKEAYIQPIAELTRSVMQITQNEQVEINYEE